MPLQKLTTYFIYRRVFKIGVHTIYSCYIQFQFTLITALYYFHKIYHNDPLNNGPLSENELPKPNKILKMISQQTGWPHLTGNKAPSPKPSEKLLYWRGL